MRLLRVEVSYHCCDTGVGVWIDTDKHFRGLVKTGQQNLIEHYANGATEEVFPGLIPLCDACGVIVSQFEITPGYLRRLHFATRRRQSELLMDRYRNDEGRREALARAADAGVRRGGLDVGTPV